MKTIYTFRLPFWLANSFKLEKAVTLATNLPWSRGRQLYDCFELSGPEQKFARTLLKEKRNYWLFRCNQKLFCGDFIIIDMSSPQPAQRRGLVLELKNNDFSKDSRPGEKGLGIQLQNAPQALEEISLAGIIGPGSPSRSAVRNTDSALELLLKTGI